MPFISKTGIQKALLSVFLTILFKFYILKKIGFVVDKSNWSQQSTNLKIKEKNKRMQVF